MKKKIIIAIIIVITILAIIIPIVVSGLDRNKITIPSSIADGNKTEAEIEAEKKRKWRNIKQMRSKQYQKRKD